MEILTNRQIAVLQSIGREKFLTANVYFTGGTPLAAFYLRHRYSEDLDFFSEKPFSTDRLFRKLSPLHPKLLQEDQDTLTVTIDGVKVSF